MHFQGDRRPADKNRLVNNETEGTGKSQITEYVQVLTRYNFIGHSKIHSLRLISARKKKDYFLSFRQMLSKNIVLKSKCKNAGLMYTQFFHQKLLFILIRIQQF